MQIDFRFKACCLILLAILMATQSFAAVPVFQHFEDIRNLKNKYIKSIVEDQYGYIWLGTTNGVYKFKNRDFTNLPTNGFLQNIHIQDLFIDKQNRLWIGTKNMGLYVYENGSVSKIEPIDHTFDSIQKIFSTGEDKLWIASNKGLFTVSDNKLIKRPILTSNHHILNNTVTALNATKSGDLIVGNIGVFHLLDVSNDVMNSVNLKTNEYIHDLHVDHENSIWIATSDKLRKFNIERNQFEHTPNLPNSTRILSLQQFGNDLWVASIDGGIYKIDITTNQVNQYIYDKNHNYSLLENHIGKIYISSRNNLWVGNFSGGLSMLDLDLLNFGFETNAIGSISCAKNSKITEISVDENEKIWLGTEYGLVKYDPKNATCKIIETNNIEDFFTIYSIRKDTQSMWLSTSIGLLEYNEGVDSIKKVAPSNKFSTVFFSINTAHNKFVFCLLYTSPSPRD